MKKSTIQGAIILILFVLLAGYVVYENVRDCDAVAMTEQINRHNRLIAGESEFYNPWQYRIFSAYVLEVLVITSGLLSDKIPPEISFYVLRFFQNILIFFSALLFYRALNIKSLVLILTGILLAAYQMSNSAFQSDLSFNTYFDIFFYLLSGYIIIKGNTWWIIPISIVAAFNRETGALIPFLLLGYILYRDKFKFTDKKNIAIAIASLAAFGIVFIALRIIYGYPPATGIHGMTSFMDYFLFNIGFFKLYPELLGTLGIIPVLGLLKFVKWPVILKVFFFILVPAWFLIHLVKSTAVETRLFLVPQLLIFIPALLHVIEHEVKKSSLFELRS